MLNVCRIVQRPWIQRDMSFTSSNFVMHQVDIKKTNLKNTKSTYIINHHRVGDSPNHWFKDCVYIIIMIAFKRNARIKKCQIKKGVCIITQWNNRSNLIIKLSKRTSKKKKSKKKIWKKKSKCHVCRRDHPVWKC